MNFRVVPFAAAVGTGLVLILWLLTGTAHYLLAGSPDGLPESGPGDPAIVTLLKQDGAVVDFIGVTPGLAGYRVTRAADDVGWTLYVTPSGHAVVGTLYRPDGLLVTADLLSPGNAVHPAALLDADTQGEEWRQAAEERDRQAAEDARAADGTTIATQSDEATEPAALPAAGAPSLDPGASPLDRLPPTRGFALGSSGRMVHVFADPACPFSRSTVARLAHAALEGELRLRVIPVALLGADSARQALAAVGADGAAAWFERRATEPTAAAAAAVRENNAALAATGHRLVPVVRTFADGAWQEHAGAVDDVAAFLEALP